MSKKSYWTGIIFLLLVFIGLIFSIWRWGGALLTPLVSDKDTREIIQWTIGIVISLITAGYGLYKFLAGPQAARKKLVDEKVLDYNKILALTSPEQLLQDYVSQNARDITWIDREALTKEQLLKNSKILLVGRMKSGKSREIAEFVQKRLEEGTFLSSRLYDITEGMRAFDSELIADSLTRKLDNGQPTLFYVNDLPRQASSKQLEVLNEYLKALERCSAGYFLATARSDHLHANPRLREWIRDNNIHVVELPSLTIEQTGRLVDELAFKKGVEIDPEVRQILCNNLDGTPYHASLTFVYLTRAGEQAITTEAAQYIVTKSAREIWLDIQKQINQTEPLAAALFEALAVFYRANVTAHPNMVKAYARSIARSRGQRYLPWGFNKRWTKVLGMLEKYDIYIQNERVQFPDAAAEITDQISPDEGQTRLENFSLGYRQFLRGALLSRFNSQAGAQQQLMSDLAINNYFKEQLEKALVLIQEAIYIAQPPSELWNNLGVLLKDKNDLEGAEAAYRMAVAADEKNAIIWYNLGVLLFSKNDLEGAEAAYRMGVAADEKHAPAWNNLGVLLEEKKDFYGAERAYRAAVAADETYVVAWNNLGLLLDNKNDLEGAEAAYRTAVAADEKDAYAWFNLGVLLQNKNDLDEAEAAYRAAVAADEKYAPAWNNLGVLLQEKNDLDGAEAAYRAAVAADEKDASAWNNLGALLDKKGDLDGAERAIREALAADKKFVGVWDNLGLLLIKKGDLDGAEAAYRAAVAADEKYASAWNLLGAILRKNNRLI